MHQFLASAVALLAAASTAFAAPNGLYFVRDTNGTNSIEPDVRTADIVAHLNASYGMNWTMAEGGGQEAIVPLDVWESATGSVKLKMKAKREAELELSGNDLTKRDNELKDGVAGHKAFFSCYNSGQKAYKASMDALIGTACGVVTKGLKAGVVKVFVSDSFWTPDHKVAKAFFTATSWGLDGLLAAECVVATHFAIDTFCQLEENTVTQGGKLAVYKNEKGSIFSGDRIAEIKADPNTCSSEIPCDTPK
jgi:hypothetical protein